jgi:hypothetical protein
LGTCPGRLLHPWQSPGTLAQGLPANQAGWSKRPAQVLRAIKTERPDLQPHGFGLKLTALSNPYVRENLESSDSMAWSFGAWKEGRDPNSWHEAAAYVKRVEERVAA